MTEYRVQKLYSKTYESWHYSKFVLKLQYIFVVMFLGSVSYSKKVITFPHPYFLISYKGQSTDPLNSKQYLSKLKVFRKSRGAVPYVFDLYSISLLWIHTFQVSRFCGETHDFGLSFTARHKILTVNLHCSRFRKLGCSVLGADFTV